MNRDFKRFNEMPKSVLYMANVFDGYHCLMTFDDYVAAGYIGFLEAEKNKHKIGNYKSYLFKKIKYRIINEIHNFSGKRRLGPRDERKYITPFFYYTFDFELILSDLDLEKKIVINDLMHYLSKLNPLYCYVIRLFYFENYNLTQIAKNCHLTKRQVRHIKSKAIDVLRNLV
jgi:RNA polymerase sigma factor (sigma-70 family)